MFRLLFLPDFKALWRLSRNDYPGGLKSGLVTQGTIASWKRATTPARKIHAAFIKINPQAVLAWYLSALVFAGLAIWLGYSLFIVSHWSTKLNCFMGFCAALTFAATGFYNTYRDTSIVAAYKSSIAQHIEEDSHPPL